MKNSLDSPEKSYPGSQTGYEYLLSAEESEDVSDDELRTPKARHNRRGWFYFIIKLVYKSVIILLTTWGVLSLSQKFLASVLPPKSINCNCGSSIAEAIANGCKYDAMATSWLPPICRDDELSAQFDSAGPGGSWTYYADQHGNRTLSLEEVSLLAEKKGHEAEFWTTHEWHINHCLFYWRKESLARKSGGKLILESSFEGDYHVHHCEEVLTACRPLGEINTRSSAGLNSDLIE